MIIPPVWVSAGVTSRQPIMTTPLTPTCPPNINNGDVLMLIITARSISAETYTITGVTGWTLDVAIASGDPSPQCYVYTIVATGIESNATVVCTASENPSIVAHCATIYRFTGCRTTNFIDVIGHNFSTGTTVTSVPIQTYSSGRLALNVVMNDGDDTEFGNFLGATGGTWVERHWSDGAVPTHGIQTMDLPSPSIVGEGTRTIPFARNVRVIGLTLAAPSPVGITGTGLVELAAENIGTAWLALLTIEHPGLPSPLRITCDGVATVSGGNTYIPFPFEIILPDDVEGRTPQAGLTIDNTTQEMVAVLRKLTSPPIVTIQIVRSADPDIVERAFSFLEWKQSQYSLGTITGTLSGEDLSTEEFPYETFNRGNWPGLWP